jgi:hypothetical protein
MMCEFAFKFAPGTSAIFPPDDIRIFACYRIRGGTDVNDPYLLDTANFDPDRVIVRQGSLMCEEAVKITADGDSLGTPTGQVWECYNLRQGDDPGKDFALVTNNFGPDRVRVGTAIRMCEDAEKHRPTAAGIVVTGQATGAVLECYRLQEGDTINEEVLLITENFGTDQVVVRRATSMCERAEKTPLFDLSGVPVDIFDDGTAE